MVDFRTLMAKPLDEVKAPPPLPNGTYHGILSKFNFAESRDKKTPYCEYSIQLTGPGDDIEASEVSDVDWSKKQLRKTFYLTEDSLYRFKEFLESLGLATAGKTIDSLIQDTLNMQVLVGVTSRPDPKDPKR